MQCITFSNYQDEACAERLYGIKLNTEKTFNCFLNSAQWKQLNNSGEIKRFESVRSQFHEKLRGFKSDFELFNSFFKIFIELIKKLFGFIKNSYAEYCIKQQVCSIKCYDNGMITFRN